MRYAVSFTDHPEHNATFDDPVVASDHAYQHAPHPDGAGFYLAGITGDEGTEQDEVLLQHRSAVNGETVVIRELP